VLDLYGFESALTNGFEQLVINYANEKLHQLITAWTLTEEQEEYAKEGIEWDDIEFFDNSVICDVIERNSCGIVSLLDEVVMRKQPVAGFFMSSSTDGEQSPDGLSALFLDRLGHVFGNHPHLDLSGGGNLVHSVASPPSTGSANTTTSSPTTATIPAVEHSFKVKHFAGSVTYDTRDFVERNVEALDRDLSRAMFECHHPLLKVLFPEGNPRRTSRRRPATTGTQFKMSLGALMNSLRSKSPHYVRCVKPNEMKQQKAFDQALVRHQIGYHG
jgi:myosin-1